MLEVQFGHVSMRYLSDVCISQFGLLLQIHHKLGGLNNKHFISHSSGGWKVQDKVLEDLMSGEGLLPGL